MGRPNPVLDIVVADEWMKAPGVIETFVKPGHRVISDREWRAGSGPMKPDALVAPYAFGFAEEMVQVQSLTREGLPSGKYPFLTVTLDAARARRKGAK